MSEEKMINSEYVQYYDVEIANDENPELTEEQEKQNQEFHKKLLMDCANWLSPCDSIGCVDLMEEHKKKLWLSHRVELSTFVACKDNFDFHVICETEHGVRNSTFLVIRECKHCHQLKLFGSGSSMALILAQSTVNAINTNGLTTVTFPVDASALPDDIVVTDLNGNPLENVENVSTNPED